MSTSLRIVRAAGLVLLLAVSFITWGPSPAAAACVNGSTRWQIIGGTCCSNLTQKWKYQSCIFGVWTDNGGTKCSGACAI